MANSASNNYKTTFRMEKNRKKEIPGTSVLSMNNTDTVVPGTSVISLDNPVARGRSRPHRWAKPSHESLVFSIDNNIGGRGLRIKKVGVPGTSTIKIIQKKDTYMSSKTERIKYPEMQGKRLFKLADQTKRPAQHPHLHSPKRTIEKDISPAPLTGELWTKETILDFDLGKTMGSKNQDSPTAYNSFSNLPLDPPKEPENVSMNVKPYTNFDAGKSLKFRLRPDENFSALPGTSILFPENDVSPDLYSDMTRSMKLKQQPSKDWRIFTLNEK